MMLNHLILGQALIRTPRYADPNMIKSLGVREWIKQHLAAR